MYRTSIEKLSIKLWYIFLLLKNFRDCNFSQYTYTKVHHVMFLKKNELYGQRFSCLPLIFRRLLRVSIIGKFAEAQFSRETLKYVFALIFRVSRSSYRSRFSLQIAVTKNKASSLNVGFEENDTPLCPGRNHRHGQIYMIDGLMFIHVTSAWSN